MKAIIITIGDEILIGQTIDSNSAWIGANLNRGGIEIDQILSVADTKEAICDGLDYGFSKSNLIICTGGLGPTKDDITKSAICSYFKCELVFNDDMYKSIQERFKVRGIPLTDAHRLQSFLPSLVESVNNAVGTAPGMWIDQNDKVLVSLPGVPYEMKSILSESGLSRIFNRFRGHPFSYRTICTAGMGETMIAEKLSTIESSLPKGYSISYLPSFGKVKVRFNARGQNQDDIDLQLNHLEAEARKLLGDICYGSGDVKIESYVGERLASKDLTVSTAESCTGGYVGHLITSIAGSSKYFMGGTIAYSNDVKISELKVPPSVLEKEGAVSEATIRYMVKGAMNRYKTSYSVATSGIAGPGGGTPNKPVGTIWIGVGNADRIDTLKLQLGKNRLKNIEYTAYAVLNMLRKRVDND